VVALILFSCPAACTKAILLLFVVLDDDGNHSRAVASIIIIQSLRERRLEAINREHD
jgi:hypothetical protein